MSRMLCAKRPGQRIIRVVDTRPEELQKEQDEIVAGIYEGVLETPNDEEDVRRRHAARRAYRGYDETEDNLRSREAHGGLSAENRKTLSTVLLHLPYLATLITQGEWERAASALMRSATDTPDPERTRELALALNLLEGFGMEDRHEAKSSVKTLVAA